MAELHARLDHQRDDAREGVRLPGRGEGALMDRTILFGGGPIGILMALALKWRGVAGDRVALAEGFGFIPLAAGSQALHARQHGQDLAIDATGVPAVAQDLTRFLSDGGAALFFGICPQSARIEIAPFELFRRPLSLQDQLDVSRRRPSQISALSFGRRYSIVLTPSQ